MNHENNDTAVLFGNGDELPSNGSDNLHINDLIAGLKRREVLAGGATLGALAFLGVSLPGQAQAQAQAQATEIEAEARGLGFPF
ncbi:Tat pathway signal protein, partial [Metapseudomonas otitidis]